MSLLFPLKIDLKSRTVVLRASGTGGATSWEAGRELMERLLAAPCVSSVSIDRARGTATLRLIPLTTAEQTTPGTTPGGTSPDGTAELRAIAACLRQPAAAHHVIGDAYAQCQQLELHKIETGITAGIVYHALPGRVRLRHPLLRKNPDLAFRIESAIRALPGVHSVAASTTTGSVLILFQPDTTTPARLLAKLERIVNGLDHSESLLAGPPLTYWVAAGTCLGLAVATEFIAPGLSTLTAVALVGFNLPTLGRGLTELCTFQWRVSALYTVIMGTTLASGQFLAAAVMQASVTSWHCWSSYRLRQVVRELTLENELPQRLVDAAAALDGQGQAVSRFTPGMIVELPVGVALPFDAIVTDGNGAFDEHRVRGISGIAVRSPGEEVFAGSILVSGHIKVEIVAVDAETRLAAIRRTVRAVIGQTAGTGGPTLRGRALASRFVPYTFATGTAAFLVGGLPTLAAVLRPDFATGPSLAERFGTLTSVSHLLHAGWLVNNPEVLHELGRTRTFVIARRDHDAASTTAACIVRTNLTVRSSRLEVHEISGSDAACLAYIHSQRTSQRIAVVACHHLLSQLTENEVIRISFTPEGGVGPQHADLIALHAEPQQLESLLRILHETEAPARNAWAVLLACNSLAISGAFLIGLTSLQVVVLTNIGALAAGAMYGRHMQRANQMLAARSLPALTAGHEISLPATAANENLWSTENRACAVDEMTGSPDHPQGVEQTKPSLRRAAARRDARLKQAAAKLMVPTSANLDQSQTT